MVGTPLVVNILNLELLSDFLKLNGLIWSNSGALIFRRFCSSPCTSFIKFNERVRFHLLCPLYNLLGLIYLEKTSIIKVTYQFCKKRELLTCSYHSEVENILRISELHVNCRYIATIGGAVSKRHLFAISEGTVIEGVHCTPDFVELLPKQPDIPRPRLRIVVHCFLLLSARFIFIFHNITPFITYHHISFLWVLLLELLSLRTTCFLIHVEVGPLKISILHCV